MQYSNTAGTERGWGFWLGWAIAFLGFPLGGLAAWALIGPVATPLAGALSGALTGAILGSVQWLALRRRLPLSLWWVAATALGMAAGIALGVALFGTDTEGAALLLRGLLAGASVGAAQSLVLREHSSRAPAWAITVALGWVLGWMITRSAGVDLSQQWTVFGSSGAVVFQLLAGLVLRWMLRRDTAALEPRAEMAA